jgi:hypothetical protein
MIRSLSSLTRALSIALLLCVTLGVGACAASQNSVDDTVALRHSLVNFHKNLRWARYEFAVTQVSPTFRERFLGRYEEMGDAFHITQLEVKKVDFEKDEDKTSMAYVRVEQEWYKEPNMTVRKEKFVETWKRERSGWMLSDRMLLKEWREIEKEKKEKKTSVTTTEPVKASPEDTLPEDVSTETPVVQPPE